MFFFATSSNVSKHSSNPLSRPLERLRQPKYLREGGFGCLKLSPHHMLLRLKSGEEEGGIIDGVVVIVPGIVAKNIRIVAVIVVIVVSVVLACIPIIISARGFLFPVNVLAPVSPIVRRGRINVLIPLISPIGVIIPSRRSIRRRIIIVTIPFLIMMMIFQINGFSLFIFSFLSFFAIR
jgi:hypothetical protein